MAEDETTLGAIHRLYGEIDEVETKIKAMRDNIKDVLIQNAEYQEIEEKLKELKNLKEQRKKILESDRDFQTLNGELDELKYKHKDLMEIMSHHLMVHRDNTHEDVVKDPDGEYRQLIINAKFGKPTIETERMNF